MKKALVFTLTILAILAITGLGLVSLRSADRAPYAHFEAMPAPSVMAPEPEAYADKEYAEEKMAKRRAKGEEGAMGKKDAPKKALLKAFGAGPGGGGYGSGLAGIGDLGTSGRGSVAMDEAPPAEAAASTEGGAGAEPAPTRAWFPETFLFEPLVVTDAQGRANVPVKVPDRLTTWRVLALAHARQGSQAGTVASFLGTLPTYVEPVTPPFLYAGDAVRLPVQVVNTTQEDVTSTLAFAVSGASLSSTGGAVKVAAGGSALQYVTLSTSTPGAAVFKATLGGTDAVEKSIELKPMGRRQAVTTGGTLAAPRTFSLTGPAEPLPGTEAVRVRVYPGALGLVRSELSAAPGRGGVAEDGYLLQLLGQSPALLRALGAKPDEAVIRELSILATQRVMQYARTPSVDTATLLAEGALAHPGNPVLSRLGERLALQVAQAQRADGTCQGATGWSLQRLLVMTADCVRAVNAFTGTPAAKQRATATSLRASGAFERNAARVSDPYTAAALLASGVVTGGVADQLRKQVLDGVATSADGAKFLKLEPGVERADGSAPSSYEATAMAILALDGAKDAPIADLGTYLLSGYSSYSGWGDGRANLVALRAAVKLFKDPVPPGVKVTLARDGKVLATGTLDANALQDVLTLEADATGSAGEHSWQLTAEPAVPGLGYSLQLVAYTPWKDEAGGGLELRTELPKTIKVGLPATVTLTAGVPGGVPMQLDLSLPAGVQADSTSLEQLVSRGAVSRFETEDGLLTLHLPPQPNGAVWTQAVTVVATLGGTLHSGASRLEPEGQAARGKDFAPLTWKVD